MKFDLKKAVLTLEDGTGTPITLAINMGEGTLTFSVKTNIEYVLNRGALDTTREGDQVPMDVRFDGIWEYLRGSGSVKTPYDFLTRTGTGSALVSTGAACEPYAVNLVLTYTPTCGAATTETITFPDFRPESIDGDAKAGTLSVTGKCNVTMPTIVRGT